MADNKALRLYKNALKWPFGKWIFSKYASRMAPYFGSIYPVIEDLKPGYCEVFIRKRGKLLNHIGTMHVIAIANGLEMAMGFMAEASIPKHLRWIPKGMDLEYVGKAGSDIRCFAKLQPNEWSVGDLPITVEALDINDNVVVKGIIHLWITEKPTTPKT